MAADTVDAVVELLGDAAGLDRIAAAPSASRSAAPRATTPSAIGGDERAVHLADRHGGEARVVLAMIEKDPSLGEPLVAGLPYLKAEAVYAARYEMARTVDDVLARRTRARLLARDAADDAAARGGPAHRIGARPLRGGAGRPGGRLPGPLGRQSARPSSVLV